MTEISTYRLTIIAAIVVLILSVGVIAILGTPDEAKLYGGLVGTIAVPGLFALFKLEQNTNAIQQRHHENQDALQQLSADNMAVKQALLAIKDNPSLSVEQAAKQAADAIQPIKPLAEKETA